MSEADEKTYQRCYPQGKFVICVGGPREYRDEAVRIARAATNVWPRINREKVEAGLRQAGIPESAVAEYMADLGIIDDTYVTDRSGW
jgi:hypothetical protein